MPVTDETPLTSYNMPLSFRLFSTFMGSVFTLSGITGMVMTLMHPFDPQFDTYLFKNFTEETGFFIILLRYLKLVFIGDGAFWGGLFHFMMAQVIFVFYPTITVHEQGIKVTSLFGLISSGWLPWDSIEAAWETWFALSWVFKIQGLGFRYAVIGLMQPCWGGVIGVGRPMENHRQLLRTIQKHRPDLFPEPYRV